MRPSCQPPLGPLTSGDGNREKDATRKLTEKLTLWLCLAALPIWTFGMCLPVTFAFWIDESFGHRVYRLWARGALGLLGIHVDVLFAHQIPSQGGVLFAPNHASLWDIPVLGSLPYPFKWVSKEEVRRIPLFGWTMSAMGCYFVKRDRSGRDLNVMKQVEEGLKNGKYVILFPEGTRTRTGEPLPLKKGAFRTAQNAGIPLMPVVLHGTFSIAPPEGIPERRGHRVSVRFGPPLRWPPSADIAVAMEEYRKTLERMREEARSSEKPTWN